MSLGSIGKGGRQNEESSIRILLACKAGAETHSKGAMNLAKQHSETLTSYKALVDLYVAQHKKSPEHKKSPVSLTSNQLPSIACSKMV